MSLSDIKKKLYILNLFKKSTNAMKLMALSLHHQIKKIMPSLITQSYNAKKFLNDYCDVNLEGKRVFIFIGSEKGFCGNYTNSLVAKFNHLNKSEKNVLFIIVGKMFFNKIKKISFNNNNLIPIYNFKFQNIDFILDQIISIFTEHKAHSIEVFSVKSVSFSEQELFKHSIIVDSSSYFIKKNYLLGHFTDSEIILSFFKNYVKNSLHLILLESLYAEQSCRFMAMDNALNSAEKIIDYNNKLYFKMRQKKINEELDDLTSNLLY